MIRAIAATALTLGLCTAALAEEGDPQVGQALVDKHCYQCHGTEVYTRENRRVSNLSELRNQVQRCDQMLGLKWFETDIADVTAYLNQAFYKF